jgi:hypothetical protein
MAFGSLQQLRAAYPSRSQFASYASAPLGPNKLPATVIDIQRGVYRSPPIESPDFDSLPSLSSRSSTPSTSSLASFSPHATSVNSTAWENDSCNTLDDSFGSIIGSSPLLELSTYGSDSDYFRKFPQRLPDFLTPYDNALAQRFSDSYPPPISQFSSIPAPFNWQPSLSWNQYNAETFDVPQIYIEALNTWATNYHELNGEDPKSASGSEMRLESAIGGVYEGLKNNIPANDRSQPLNSGHKRKRDDVEADTWHKNVNWTTDIAIAVKASYEATNPTVPANSDLLSKLILIFDDGTSPPENLDCRFDGTNPSDVDIPYSESNGGNSTVGTPSSFTTASSPYTAPTSFSSAGTPRSTGDDQAIRQSEDTSKQRLKISRSKGHSPGNRVRRRLLCHFHARFPQTFCVNPLTGDKYNACAKMGQLTMQALK